MIIRTNVTIPTGSKKVAEVKPEVKKTIKADESFKVSKKKKVAVPVQPTVETETAEDIMKKVSEWDFDD